MWNYFWCYFRQLFVSLAILENATKDFEILNIILVQDFCPLKSDIARSAIGFHLNALFKEMQYALVSHHLFTIQWKRITFHNQRHKKIVFSFFYLRKFEAVI